MLIHIKMARGIILLLHEDEHILLLELTLIDRYIYIYIYILSLY
jgi:hypothetical protein